MEELYELGDSDLIVCDMETGLNNYTKNLKFADELEDLAKCLIVLSGNCNKKANKIWDRVDTAKEDKRLIQDIVELREVKNLAEKDLHASLKEDPKPWIKTSEFFELKGRGLLRLMTLKSIRTKRKRN